ncbi:hypothetical protein ABID26_002308 [Mesorhizobium shonense]|uniref:Uncharacterized protein n=1 Tax=Mesorhizobium shonense TaxID=1209948 RepID=A0ABV2HQN5_9HYPH
MIYLSDLPASPGVLVSVAEKSRNSNMRRFNCCALIIQPGEAYPRQMGKGTPLAARVHFLPN